MPWGKDSLCLPRHGGGAIIERNMSSCQVLLCSVRHFREVIYLFANNMLITINSVLKKVCGFISDERRLA